ncbi:hypothetical protein P0R31_10875 [Bradyrhizobium yuanmingense]|uniref:hypothetical protein n=1 Tax=Bradyrhizobium yuanmingense TaxID=108015 RepID=UPI0023B93DDA|nr:hypothetical protein [Bradyrhizobium yuanmingense]MDF0517735.1 hypothetical protein [Bradyrhizobium yuanmingense]
MIESQVASEAADKIFRFLSAHMTPQVVADAMIVAAVAEMVAAVGRPGAADMLRRLADRVEAEKPPAVH